MKAETSKSNKQKALTTTSDPRLDEIFEGKILFPEKLAQANKFLAEHPLPDHLKKNI